LSLTEAGLDDGTELDEGSIESLGDEPGAVDVGAVDVGAEEFSLTQAEIDALEAEIDALDLTPTESEEGTDESEEGTDESEEGADESEEGADESEEDGAGQPVPPWLAGLHPMIPEWVFAPFDPARRRYCFRKLGASEHCGMIVFADLDRACAYMDEFLARRGFTDIRPLTLDLARDIARGYHWRVDCLAAIDDPHQPIIQVICWP